MGQKFASGFGARLKEAREEAGLPQAEVALGLGLGAGSISAWEHGRGLPNAQQVHDLCRILKCSASWLVGLSVQKDTKYPEAGGGLKWHVIKSFPIGDQISQEVEQGIALFDLIARQKLTFNQLQRTAEFGGYGEVQLRQMVRVALFSGAIQLIDVERDIDLERDLLEAFPMMRKCIVARTDFPADSLIDAAIRAEAVAFLAARDTVKFLPVGGSCGLSGGTTMSRFVDMLPPASPLLRGISWLPLLVAKDPHIRTGLSANSVVTRLIYRQPGATAYRLSFVEPKYRQHGSYTGTTELEYVKRSHEVLDLARNVSVAYISVGTPEFRFKTTDAYLGLPELMNVLEGMSEDDRMRCKGDILLQLVDDTAMRVGTPDDQAKNDALVYSIGLDSLRSIAKFGTVWVLAARAGSGKAEVIRGALLAGYANSVVIERSVAAALLALK
jgi:DNA-binding transcriptional regulator LsrR (DeoR family)/DNA-binding XRE family transcriptional regulator